MIYVYMLSAGILVSFLHFYLVWLHQAHCKLTLSEHVIIDRKSHLLYFVTHVIYEILFLTYSYKFFIVAHKLSLPFNLIFVSTGLDFIQAALPSRGRTEKAHVAAAYVSWLGYLLAGLVALVELHVLEPYQSIAVLLLILIVGMFAYMHICSTKIYTYQLIIVPLYFIYMLFITIGAT